MKKSCAVVSGEINAIADEGLRRVMMEGETGDCGGGGGIMVDVDARCGAGRSASRFSSFGVIRFRDQALAPAIEKRGGVASCNLCRGQSSAFVVQD